MGVFQNCGPHKRAERYRLPQSIFSRVSYLLECNSNDTYILRMTHVVEISKSCDHCALRNDAVTSYAVMMSYAQDATTLCVQVQDAMTLCVIRGQLSSSLIQGCPHFQKQHFKLDEVTTRMQCFVYFNYVWRRRRRHVVVDDVTSSGSAPHDTRMQL